MCFFYVEYMKEYLKSLIYCFRFKPSDNTRKYKISQEVFNNFDFLPLVDNIYVSLKKAKKWYAKDLEYFFTS